MAAEAAPAAAAARPPLSFALTPTTRLVLHMGSITEFTGDVIVAPANEMLVPNWGASRAILQAAGHPLLEALAKLPARPAGQVKCATGSAVLTSAGRLPVRHVVHAVGPVYTVPEDSEPLLASTYRSALALANEHKAASIAFTAISCGLRGYPPQEAAEVALRVCQAEAGGLQSIHFYFMGDAELQAWLRQAAATLQPLPQTPTAQSSARLSQLMQAAQAGREEQVLDLLLSLVATLGAGPAEAAANEEGAAGEHLQVAAPASQEGGGPGSASPCDRRASSSLCGPSSERQQAQPSGGSGAAGSPGSFSAVDVRRWTYDYGAFRKLRRLGAGSFGEVWLADYKGTSFALKQLFLGGHERAAAGPPPPLGAAELREFQREAELVADVHHPHVLAFMGVCLEPPCLVTEYCAQGSLYDVLKQAAEGGPIFEQLTWARRLSLLWGAAKGMAALHSHSPPIVHRDLRSPNILISTPWVAKVGDFNLSRFADDSTAARTQPSVAPARNPRWLAPEALHSIMEHERHPATFACDAWSFGMCMYEVLTWRVPYADIRNDYGVVGAILRRERPCVPSQDELPGVDMGKFVGLDAYLGLMHDCWAEDPASRPSFECIAQRLHRQLQAHLSGQRGATATEAAGRQA